LKDGESLKDPIYIQVSDKTNATHWMTANENQHNVLPYKFYKLHINLNDELVNITIVNEKEQQGDFFNIGGQWFAEGLKGCCSKCHNFIFDYNLIPKKNVYECSKCYNIIKFD